MIVINMHYLDKSPFAIDHGSQLEENKKAQIKLMIRASNQLLLLDLNQRPSD